VTSDDEDKLTMDYDQKTVRTVLDQVRADNRQTLTSEECQEICTAYRIAVPKEGLATSADEAASLATDIGYPVALKIASTDILHKTDAGGVLIDLASAEDVKSGYESILANCRSHSSEAKIAGVTVQQMVTGSQEVIVGSITDPVFGKLVAFGLGGIMVELLKDVTFRLAPATRDQALSMLNDITGSEVLDGIRGGKAIDKERLADIITNVSQLAHDFPEIDELDLNPVMVSEDGAIAVDAVIVVDFEEKEQRYRPSQEEILTSMRRIMQPDAVAVI
jgi:acyl-CoA synthetase (NDP forming)